MATPPHLVPPALAAAPFLASDAVRRGLLTHRQLQGSAYRRILCGVHAPADLPDTVAVRASALALVLPRGAVVSHLTAAWLHGADILPMNAGLFATVPRDSAPLRRPGVTCRQALLPAADLTVVHGVPVTTPMRTAFDLARQSPLTEGVVAVDALARVAGVHLGALAAYAAEHRGWRGVRQVPRVVNLADPRAESPQETRCRLVLVLGGLPRPDVQVDLYDAAGTWLARVDMYYASHRLVLEYEGATHKLSIQADLERLGALQAAGYTVMRLGPDDVLRAPGRMVRRVGRILASPPTPAIMRASTLWAS